MKAVHSHPTPAVRSGQRGFTLIELLVTMTVAVVLLSVAVPGFQTISRNNRMTSIANSLVSSAQLARSEAINRNSPVELCRSADGATCATAGGWQQGWIVRHPTSNTVISVQQPLPAGFTVAGPNATLAFQSTGAGVAASTFRVCPSPLSSDGAGREIQLSAVGRAQVSKTRTGICT